MTAPALARSLPRVPSYALLAAGGLCTLWVMLGAIIAPAARRHDS